MTVLDNKLITAGGVTKSNEFTNNVLVLETGRWKDYSTMPTARSCSNAIGHNSILIIVGGKANNIVGKVIVVPNVELLDTTSGCWYTCNNLPTPCYQLQAAVVNNALYLLGGDNSSRQPSSLVFSASLETLSTHQLIWQSLTNTPWNCSRPVGLSNKLLLAVGGRHSSDPTIQSSEIHALNPSTGLWKLITNIPVPTSGPAVVGVADNKIIVLGGSVGFGKRLFSSNVWSGTFE